MAYSRPQGDAPNPAVVDLLFAKVSIRDHTPEQLGSPRRGGTPIVPKSTFLGTVRLTIYRGRWHRHDTLSPIITHYHPLCHIIISCSL